MFLFKFKKLFFILIIFSIFSSFNLSIVHAEIKKINPDKTLIQPTNKSTSINKIIFSKVKKRKVLNISQDKYAKEILYFFAKSGLKRSPVSHVLFESGEIFELNPEWHTEQTENNLNEGVIFVLLIYENNFDINNFKNVISQYKDDFLKKNIPTLSLNSSDNIEIRDFQIELHEDKSLVSFKEKEVDKNFQDLFADIDFNTKFTPDLKLKDIAKLDNISQKSINKVKITIENNSDFNYMIQKNKPLSLTFEDKSKYFVNDLWPTDKVALLIDNGLIKAKSSQEYEISLKSLILPGEMNEEIRLELDNKILDSKKLELNVIDSGIKVLKILQTEIGYLNIRSEPSTSSNEIGRAEAGELYELLEIFENENFYKIQLTDSLQGWVFGQYIEVVKEK